MLTGDLVRPRLRRRGEAVWVEQIRLDDAHWLHTAEDLITLFEAHHTRSRAAWEAALEAYEGDRTDYDVLRGLAKVLTDAATFEPPPTPIDPTQLRQRLFSQGPVFDERSLFQPYTRQSLLEEVAADEGLTPAALDAALFADLPGAYQITELGREWTPDGLIARYNLELARGVLYWASDMTVDLYDNFKDFWRYLKLFKLMFWATPIEGGYHVEVDGPISPFVHSSTRYGRQMAAFLPALLLGERWHMEATIRMSHFETPHTYRLNDSSMLPSVFKRSGRFDSRMEADFAAEFHEKFGDDRSGWQLQREDEVLLLGDSVFIPDFSLEKEGRRALIEIVGFWHPDYLRRKLAKVRQANRDNMLLLVYEGVNLSKKRLQNVPGEVLYFVNKPILKHVMAAVERIAK